MNVNDASQIAADALEALTAALAAGKSEALTQYLAMQARFHRYSFGNVMMILSQKPDATNVAGFHAWRGMGRLVRRGGTPGPFVCRIATRTGSCCFRRCVWSYRRSAWPRIGERRGS